MSLFNLDNSLNFYGKKYKCYDKRITITLDASYYMFLNAVRGDKTLSRVLREILVNNNYQHIFKALKDQNIRSIAEDILQKDYKKKFRTTIGVYKKEHKTIKKQENINITLKEKLDFIRHCVIELNMMGGTFNEQIK